MGVGHFWVKRLFIDRNYKIDPNDPEGSEDPDDYLFIPATVEDNTAIMKSNPRYVKALAKMPNAKAYRYGDWDSLGGNYFSEFSEARHLHKPFKLPKHWQLYRSIDYGLDKTACMWWAVDEDGRSWCFRSFEQSNLNIQDAAQRILEHTMFGENIMVTYAPPDLWNRQRETGRTIAEIFALTNCPLTKSDNNRVQGHMIMRSMLMDVPLADPYVIEVYGGKGKAPDKLPALMFFDDVGGVIKDVQSIQADETNPNDCSKDPHELTHCVDACVAGDTMIATPFGCKPIESLKHFGLCYAWDEKRKKKRLAIHTPAIRTRKNAKLYELVLDNGEKIEATADHRVLTAAGWKRMDELSAGDDVLSAF